MKSFTVPGKPVPQGSMRARAFVKDGKAFATLVHNKADALANYRADVRAYAERAGVTPQGGPVRLEISFYVPRPKAQFNSKGQVKDSAPAWPIKPPDADKLTRAVLDGLTGVAYFDDSQVVEIRADKCFAPSLTPSTLIAVSWLEEETVSLDAARARHPSNGRPA